MHTADPEKVKGYQKLLEHIGDVQAHMLQTWEFIQKTPEYTERCKEREKQKAQQKGKGCIRKEPDQPRGPRADFEKIREQHRDKHNIAHFNGCDVCYDCGRTASLDLQPMLQTNIWRQPCKPRTLYDKALKQGHLPVLVQRPRFRMDGWACRKCHWTSNNLLSRRCHKDSTKASDCAPNGNAPTGMEKSSNPSGKHSNGMVEVEGLPQDLARNDPIGKKGVPPIFSALMRGMGRLH